MSKDKLISVKTLRLKIAKDEVFTGAAIEYTRRLNYMIDRTPAVDAVPVVRGRWIVDECDRTDTPPCYLWIDFHCSECDTEFSLEEGAYGWNMESEIPFKCCPVCEAKMHGGVTWRD